MPRCPHLTDDNRCNIYHTDRFNCCRSYPNIANPHLCIDAHRCTKDCATCTDNCCLHIHIGKEGPYTVKDFEDALNISCEECDQVWCQQK